MYSIGSVLTSDEELPEDPQEKLLFVFRWL
jgi:hypothetical protein